MHVIHVGEGSFQVTNSDSLILHFNSCGNCKKEVHDRRLIDSLNVIGAIIPNQILSDGTAVLGIVNEVRSYKLEKLKKREFIIKNSDTVSTYQIVRGIDISHYLKGFYMFFEY